MVVIIVCGICPSSKKILLWILSITFVSRLGESGSKISGETGGVGFVAKALKTSKTIQKIMVIVVSITIETKLGTRDCFIFGTDSLSRQDMASFR